MADMFSRALHSKTVAAVSAWITIFGVLFWILAKLTPSWFGQLTWSQLILLAIGLSVATLFVIAVSVALFAVGFRKVFPAPASEIGEELERTKERLKRAEERLDGARVAPAVLTSCGGGDATGQSRGLTAVERERAASALADAFDFLGGDLHDFYRVLAVANQGVSEDLLRGASQITLDNVQALANRAGGLWHRHSHYLDLVNVDILTVQRHLEALRNPLIEASAATTWPPDAQAKVVQPLRQAISDLGGSMGNLRNAISEARQELGR